MVVSSRFFERTGVAAGVEQREAAGAVGRFHHAGLEAGLADGRRLLVAGDAARSGSRRRTARRRSSPKSPAQSCTSGSMARGMRRSFSSSSSQSPVSMLKSSVREALVASVACTLPPVSRQIRKRIDGAEAASSPRSARSRAPGTLSSIQRDLGAGEIGIEQQAGLR